MKRYLVFLTDLALAPLAGQNPRGGKLQEFDVLSASQKFAEIEKENWDKIIVFERIGNGELNRLEQYHKGRRYPGSGAVNDDCPPGG